MHEDARERAPRARIILAISVFPPKQSCISYRTCAFAPSVTGNGSTCDFQLGNGRWKTDGHLAEWPRRRLLRAQFRAFARGIGRGDFPRAFRETRAADNRVASGWCRGKSPGRSKRRILARSDDFQGYNTRIFHGAVEKLSKVLVKTSEERFASRSRGHRTTYIPLTHPVSRSECSAVGG